MTGVLKTSIAWIVLILTIAVVLFAATGESFSQIMATQDGILRKHQLLNRLQSLPAKENTIRLQLETLNDVAAAKYLYEGDRRGTQTAIQRDVRQLAAQSNIQLGSMRTLGVSNGEGRLHRASIQANFVTTNEKLLDFLLEIEVWEPLLRVQRMSVRVSQASTADQDATLSIMLEIAGFYQNAVGLQK